MKPGTTVKFQGKSFRVVCRGERAKFWWIQSGSTLVQVSESLLSEDDVK